MATFKLRFAHIRAGAGALNWSMDDLAKAAGLVDEDMRELQTRDVLLSDEWKVAALLEIFQKAGLEISAVGVGRIQLKTRSGI